MIKLIKEIYTDDKFRLESPLPMDFVTDKIRSQTISEIDIFNSSIYSSEYMFRGKISLHKFTLRLTKSGSVNSFSKILYGKIYKYNNGTLLTGIFKVHKSVKIFIPIWFLFAIIFFISNIFSLISTSEPILDQLFIFLISILLILFGLGFVYFAATWGNKDIKIISDLLKTSLNVEI